MPSKSGGLYALVSNREVSVASLEQSDDTRVRRHDFLGSRRLSPTSTPSPNSSSGGSRTLSSSAFLPGPSTDCGKSLKIEDKGEEEEEFDFASLQWHWRCVEQKPFDGSARRDCDDQGSKTRRMREDMPHAREKVRVVSHSSVSAKSESDSSTISTLDRFADGACSSFTDSVGGAPPLQAPLVRKIGGNDVGASDDTASMYSEAEAIELPELDSEGALNMVRKYSLNRPTQGISESGTSTSVGRVSPKNPQKARCISSSLMAKETTTNCKRAEITQALTVSGTARCLSEDELCLMPVDVSSDDVDTSCREELAHRDSIAASFARRAANNIDTRSPGRPRAPALVEVRKDAKRPAKSCIESSLSREILYRGDVIMERCAHALSELLDQNPVVSKRLTESTRAFAPMFASNEKQILGLVVRRALYLIRKDHVGQSRHFDGSRLTSIVQKLAAARPLASNEQPSFNLVRETSSKGDLICSPQSVRLAREVLLGDQRPKPVRRGVTSSAWLIRTGDSRADLDPAASRIPKPLGFRTPLVNAVNNESIDLRLPFASALLAVLGTMARLDCEVSFKRFRNRNSLENRNAVRSALINAQACQDHTGRSFSFEIALTGGSPARIHFRRPRFISLRRVDDYVDIVVDSKELLVEYCAEIWGEV